MSTKETKTNKTILRVLFAAAVLLLFCGAAVGAAAGDNLIEYNGATFTDQEGESYILGGTVEGVSSPFTEYVAGETPSGNATYDSVTHTLTLMGDVTLSYTLKVVAAEGLNFTINLNGHVLQYQPPTGDAKASVITVANNAKLTVKDDSTNEYTFFKVTGGIDESTYKWEICDAPTSDVDVLTVEDLSAVTYPHVTSKTQITSFEQLTSSAIGDDGKIVMLKGGCITGGSGSDVWGSGDEFGGGGVYVTGGAFEMSGGNIVGNSVNYTGGGVFVMSGTFTMSGGSISGNYANGNHGGGVYVTGGAFEMSGGKIVGNSTTHNGGGVFFYSDSKTFTLSGTSSIIGNSAVTGGGVYVGKSSTWSAFEMSGGTISGNIATGSGEDNGGGGVYVEADCEFEMSDGSISGNKVGGAAANNVYGGGVYFAGTTFTFSGGTIGGTGANDGNIAICKNPGNTSKSEGGTSSGGGVYLKSGTFDMSADAKIIGNKAIMTENQDVERYGNSECNGGGVFVAGGTFTMSNDAEISSNTVESNASGGGGGVCITGGTGHTMSGGSITNNTVTVVFSSDNYSVKVHGGGGVKLLKCSFTMSGGSITNNIVQTSGSGSKIVTQGGGVYIYSEGAEVAFTMQESETTGTNGTITGNSAEHGGGVYIGQKSKLAVSGKPNISENTSKAGVSDKNNVYLDDYFTPQPLIKVNGTLDSGAYIGIKNPLIGQFGEFTTTAAPPTGPFKMDDKQSPEEGDVAVDGKKLLWNIPVAELNGTTYKTVGAAVEAATGDATITMIANSIEEGITIPNGTKVTLDLAGHMLRNADGKPVITVESGGELVVKDGSSSITHYFQVSDYNEWGTPGLVTPWGYRSTEPTDTTNVTIALFDIKSYNGADGGWAYYDNTNKKYTYKYVTVTGGVISGGSTDYGGGVYVNGGTFTMEGGNIVGSKTTSGGGVYVNGGTFTMEGGKVVGNTVTSNGGGVCVESGTFKMSGGNIIGNNGKDSCGVYVNVGTFEVSGNPVIKGNLMGTTAKNVYLEGENKLILAGNFTGEIYISEPEPNGGNQFGTAETDPDTGEAYSGAANFISDKVVDGKHYVGELKEGNTLNWSDSGEQFYEIKVASAVTGKLIPSASSAAKGAQISLAAALGYTMSNPQAYKTGDQSTIINIDDNNTFTMPDYDVTVTAEFTESKYKIIYKDQGDVAYSGDNESSLRKVHTYGTPTLLVDGTKAGYTFDGWFTEKSCFGSKVTTLGATDYTADITLYAKWTKKSSGGSSSPQGSSVWLTETPEPTAAPTPTPTPTPGTEVPTVKPVPTQAGKTPVPFMGVIAGLGAAAVVFGLRRK